MASAYPHSLRGGRGDSFGNLPARPTQVAADLLDCLIEGEPRLSADDEQIEGVGHRLFEPQPAPRRQSV